MRSTLGNNRVKEDIVKEGKSSGARRSATENKKKEGERGFVKNNLKGAAGERGNAHQQHTGRRKIAQ